MKQLLLLSIALLLFKDQDPEKYCLNHNDPAFCKTIGDVCNADGFVKPDGAYITNQLLVPFEIL